MKKITLLLLTLAFFSCGKSKEENLDLQIKDYISKNADDPASYEPLETKFKEVIKKSDYAERVIKNSKFEIELLDSKIEEVNYKISDYKSKGEFFASLIPTNVQILETYNFSKELYNKKIEAATSQLKDTTTLFNLYVHKFRLKNKLGALTLQDYYVYTNASDSIVVFDKDFKSAFNNSMEYYNSKFIE